MELPSRVDFYLTQKLQVSAEEIKMRGRLYRSTRNRVISGVCGGLGEYFDLDPILFRIVFLFFLPFALWVYLILWMALPEDPRWYPKL